MTSEILLLIVGDIVEILLEDRDLGSRTDPGGLVGLDLDRNEVRRSERVNVGSRSKLGRRRVWIGREHYQGAFSLLLFGRSGCKHVSRDRGPKFDSFKRLPRVIRLIAMEPLSHDLDHLKSDVHGARET